MKQKKQPFITILILTASTEKPPIERCIQSITSSSYKHYEILFINNTNDETLARTIRKHSRKARTITLYANIGAGAYNTGFTLAKGEAILAIDSDCEIFPDTLEKIAHMLSVLPKTVGVLATNVFNKTTNTYYYNQTYVTQRPLYTFPGGASVFRKEMLSRVGFYDPLFFLWLHEDDLALRILNKGLSIYFVSHIRINHYDAARGFRSKLAFFVFRNKAWLNIKHFSLTYFPALIFRDSIWLLIFPFHTRSIASFFVGLYGYIIGYLTAIVPLINRRVINEKAQKQFLSFYYSYRG